MGQNISTARGSHTHHSLVLPREGRWLFAGFLALVFWLPLPLGSNLPWAWSLTAAWSFALFGVWLWRFHTGRTAMSHAFISAWPVFLLLSLAVAWSALQAVPIPLQLLHRLSPETARLYDTAQHGGWGTISIDPHATAQAALRNLMYLAIFSLTLLLTVGQRRLVALAYTVVFAGLFQAVYGSLMTLSGMEYGFFAQKEHYLGVATGTFVNRNHLAGWLEMSLAVGIGLMIAGLSRSGRHTWRSRGRHVVTILLGAKVRLRIYLAVMVVALILTHSRMGNTAFFASLGVAGLVAVILFRERRRGAIILLASLLVIDLFIVGAWFGADEVARRIGRTDMVTDHRDEVLHHSLDLWQDHLIVGTGAGSYYTAFPRYRKDDVALYFNHAHNDYLEYGTEYGLVGFSLLAAAILWSLARAIMVQKRRHNPMSRGMGFASTMGTVSLLIHSTVDFNLQIPANAALFTMLLALCWVAGEQDGAHRRHGKRTIQRVPAVSSTPAGADASAVPPIARSPDPVSPGPAAPQP